MKYNRLGGSGLKVSALSIGSWVTYGRTVEDGTARACLLAAFERGVNFFDNAEAYGFGAAEIVVGKVLEELRREDYVVSSKVFWGGEGPNDQGLSRKHVVEACHAALRRLKVDYLDLYLCHRPDPDTPVLETALAMDILVRQGKVLYWGTSEWNAEQLAEAYAVCDTHGLVPPQVEQPQYHMLWRDRVEKELVPHMEQRGLGTTTWSPLASGLLTGKYLDGIPAGSRLAHPDYAWLTESVITEERLETVRKLAPIARDLGGTLAQLALAWAARDPSRVSTVITGASRPEQVNENMDALELVDKLTPEVLERIEAVLDNRPS